MVVDVDGVLFQQSTGIPPIAFCALLKRRGLSTDAIERFYDAPKIPVDKDLNEYIAGLITAGHLVVALTACDMRRAPRREWDLRSCGIDLSLWWGGIDISFGWGRFKSGVFYCGAKGKGRALFALIDRLSVEFNRPGSSVQALVRQWGQTPFAANLRRLVNPISRISVIVIDDDKHNLENITMICSILQCSCICILYTQQKEWYTQHPQLAQLVEYQILALEGGYFLSLPQAEMLARVLTPCRAPLPLM
jgi:hypothetical protein